jgi:hypothetical protein
MSFLPLQLQIVSDLHLETPISKPAYLSFRLHVTGTHLFLLGDIGLVKDTGLFTFLRHLLDSHRGTRVFYVLSNHEAYQTTLHHAVSKLRDFEKEAAEQYGARFRFLHRDRVDFNTEVTILGCTLWSNIQPRQVVEVCSRLTDFHESRGIQDWSSEKSQQEHRKDVAWLNAQVLDITTREPHRQILIVTHHCPTVDARASDPAHSGSTISSAFVSDLSREVCWTTPQVRLWAFGHTHFSCAFREEGTGKLIVANQRGYAGLGRAGGSARSVKVKIVLPKGEEWQVADDLVAPVAVERRTTTEVEEPAESTKTLGSGNHTAPRERTQNPSVLQRVTQQAQRFRRLISQCEA